MTPAPIRRPDGADRRARGQALRQARSIRVAGIRRRVVASALALFVATWLLITMMLITGHDPALATNRTTTAKATTTTAAGAGTGTTNPTTGTTTTTTSSSTSSSPTSLTSSQS